MADKPIDEVRFTDREVQKILKKAVERAPSRALAKKEGLSLAELKSIGEEVGIDPARLEDAARAVAYSEENAPNRFLGAPTVVDFERKVEGEFDREDTPEILSLIRRIMGEPGEITEIHGSLEWRATGESGTRFITVSSRDGTTTIFGSANLSQAAVLAYLPVGMLGFIGSVVGLIVAANNGFELGMILSLSILPILYPILRATLRTVTEKESTKLQRAVDELARLREKSGE